MELVNVKDIKVAPNRQRREFDDAAIVELSESIGKLGLLQPVVIRGNNGSYSLVAGERRLRALSILWATSQQVNCNGRPVPDNCVPCVNIGELDPISAFEAELDENIRRADLTWQEKAEAIAKLHELRSAQNPAQTIGATTQEIHGTSVGSRHSEVRDQIIVSRYLEDPEIAKAPTLNDARKIIQRREDLARYAVLGKAAETNDQFTAINSEALTFLAGNGAGIYDVILSDPPYGMGADEFGDSAGKTRGAHTYEDSFETWLNLMIDFIPETFRVAKLQAHMYLFCDIDRFHELRDLCARAGWKPFRTPIIWVNPTANRAPWPQHGPQRKWQSILFCIKGDRFATKLYGDVITVPSDPNLGHQAQKPVQLYTDLLGRSARPGDHVLDPFAGTGPIYPAAHRLKCRATGIERDPAYHGISVSRIQKLKGEPNAQSAGGRTDSIQGNDRGGSAGG